MNIEKVEAWINELASGNYNQTTGTLRNIDEDTGKASFCCLGVACDVSNLGSWESTDEYVIQDEDTGVAWDLHGDLDADDPVAMNLGLNDELINELVILNDNGAPFDAIAAFLKCKIQEQVKKESEI